MIRFVSLAISPWSEKARFALLHHRIDFHEEKYIPFIGEPLLRLRLHKWSGRVTVPVLHDGTRWYTDSFDIARYAESHGSGAPLIPESKLSAVREWNQRSEVALAACRALLMATLGRDPAITMAVLPQGLPQLLLPAILPLARLGNQLFARKYDIEDAQIEAYRTTVWQSLTELESALSVKKDYLLGEFSYADIAMAVLLQAVRPVDRRFVASLPGTGRGDRSLDPELVRRFAGLLEWRDRLYARHRPMRR